MGGKDLLLRGGALPDFRIPKTSSKEDFEITLELLST